MTDISATFFTAFPTGYNTIFFYFSKSTLNTKGILTSKIKFVQRPGYFGTTSPYIVFPFLLPKAIGKIK